MIKNVLPNYNEMSMKAAEIIIDIVKRKPDALLCFAAGSTPLGTFGHLVEAGKQGKVNFDKCVFVSLDEWVGLSRDVEGSCKQTLYDHFFDPLSIRQDQIVFFDGMNPDLTEECEKMDKYIQTHGPIDLFLLGIGMNGHLGFNEPGVDFDLYSHVINLDPVTKQVSSKYFQTNMELTQGITLGIRYIMEARTVLLIANGSNKAEILQQSFTGPVTNEVPASILQNHPKLIVCIDELADKFRL